MENGELSFTANFFDANGKILCEIVENRFRRNPNNTWDMEVTPHRVKILDDRKVTVLDVEYINAKAIRVLGDFYLRRGFHAELTTEQVRFGNVALIGLTMFSVVGGQRPVAVWVDEPEVASGRMVGMAVTSPGAAAEAAQRNAK